MEYEHIKVYPRTVAIGADIDGVSLSQLSDEIFEEIKLALHKHLVLFFHDQKLTEQQHMACASRLGEMEIHEVFTPLAGHPEISVLEHDEQRPPISDSWHSDVSYRAKPSMASVLYARTIPAIGGDTLWRSAYAAFDDLSEALQLFLEKLHAEHDFLQAYGDYLKKQDGGLDKIRQAQINTPPMIHPLIVKHPITQKKLLYVNPTFTSRIVELNRNESDTLLRFLFTHLDKPEFHVRLKWRENDLVIWDNRATQHYATGDYYPQYRRMHRITVGGDQPLGCDNIS